MPTIVTAPSPTVRALVTALLTWDRHTVRSSFGHPEVHTWHLVDGAETWSVEAERGDVHVHHHVDGSASGWHVATTGLAPAVLLSTLTALGCPEVEA